MPTIIPFYFNQFFPRCNPFFQEIENFSHRQGKYLPDFAEYFPKVDKQRFQEPPQGQLPQSCPRQQGQGAPQPQVPPADAEAVEDPAGIEGRDKQAVRPPPVPQGPQEAADQPRSGPQGQPPEHRPGGESRLRHPSSLPSSPRARGSS